MCVLTVCRSDRGGGAVEDRREHRERCPRVVLSQPQRRHGGAHLPRFALLLVHLCQGLRGGFGLTRAQQGMHHERPHLRRERVRRNEKVGLPSGCPESGHRVGVMTAREFECPAKVVEQQSSCWFGFGAQHTLGAP